MNLLAHAYLSFNNPNLLVGNMISDYVKGKNKFSYPTAIQKGIELHRAIDTFTDAHVATKNAKEFFRKDYRLYAGACVDIVYDHFLANDTNEFTSEEVLNNFAQTTYVQLEQNKQHLPEKVFKSLPYMQSQNWLYNYRYMWGIQKSFEGLIRRSAYLTDSETAFKILSSNYSALKSCYQSFFPEVKQMAQAIVESHN